jgi:hypothetical protein
VSYSLEWLPPYTPQNVVRMLAGELLANNQAHEIKNDYDSNNPPPPEATRTGGAKTIKE